MAMAQVNRSWGFAAWAVVCLICVASIPSARADEAAHKAQAQELVRAFATELQGALKAALEEGGPLKAIPVCSQKAPEIAARLSRESGAYIRRVSLKARNPQGTPDAWEQGVLSDFDAKANYGGDAAALAAASVVEEPAGSYFRFVKAIPTQALCLACHGEQLDPTVEAALKQSYPHDVARGYRVGMVRGAFSVKMRTE